jgi:hypothetical protein
MSTPANPSPELKQLWIRVLKRVHPDLAINERDRLRCERLTKEANAAYATGDIEALTAVLEPKAPPPPPPPQAPPNAWGPRTYAGAQQAQQAPPRAQQQAQQQQTPMQQMPHGLLWLIGWVIASPVALVLFLLRKIRAQAKTAQQAQTQASILLFWKSAFTALLVLAVPVGIIMGIGYLEVRWDKFNTNHTASAQEVAPVAAPTWTGCIKTSPGDNASDLIVSVQKEIAKNVSTWPEQGRTGIRFVLLPNGNVTDMVLDYPSGIVQRDREAWAGITRSAFTQVAQQHSDDLRVPIEIGCYISFDSKDQPETSYYSVPVATSTVTPAVTPAAAAPVAKPAPMPATEFGRKYPWYVDQVKNRVAQQWHLSEVLDSTPAGATVYVRFNIGRHGYPDDATVETSSGHYSLDQSCIAAVGRVDHFDDLPEGYTEKTLNVLYHCTYPGKP